MLIPRFQWILVFGCRDLSAPSIFSSDSIEGWCLRRIYGPDLGDLGFRGINVYFSILGISGSASCNGTMQTDAQTPSSPGASALDSSARYMLCMLRLKMAPSPSPSPLWDHPPAPPCLKSTTSVLCPSGFAPSGFAPSGLAPLPEGLVEERPSERATFNLLTRRSKLRG
ncbi:hypothetical protein BDK51DRAFT_47524 [Blyttiomyces helicus]|uniref:Uncharacterized protein n=1 Tax=Blyttiomyces helicus TaxID=388810 RepID=A0A4P9W2B7_9FUNG|nr:hypothetical protein BDK51DRAFT_47524 [Blyttiomyces helicus]|eukprot:RKO85862.1 hypothetical protein BDK51DRAFT_47524 [Blyttiomyces helicus]